MVGDRKVFQDDTVVRVCVSGNEYCMYLSLSIVRTGTYHVGTRGMAYLERYIKNE